MTVNIRDQFLSDEDLDLKSLTDAQLERVWNAWLKQAQCTNDRDRYEYSHGVFTVEPPCRRENTIFSRAAR